MEDARRAAFLTEGSTCWRRTSADRAAVLVDAAAYFGALRSSLLEAQRSIYILGWELNSRTCLEGPEGRGDRAPREIGKLLKWLLRRRRGLTIRILLWNHPMIYAVQREWFPRWIFGWRKLPRLQIMLDGHVPLGAAHHEKVVVIDDRVAYCGGVDLTLRRWDTPEHMPDDPRRCDPSDKPYVPVHDVQLVVEGAAAAALGERARDRWVRAGGDREARRAPAAPNGDCWPRHVKPDFENVPLGIIRTRCIDEPEKEIREVERSTVEAISRAERLVYIENQYVTSKAAAHALRDRMRQNPALEAIVLTTRDPHGWLEYETMWVGRQRFMALFAEPHLRRRIRFLYPYARARDEETFGAVDGMLQINVHAKVLIVDDAFLRIGSSNLNNRSMGFDTECDLGVEAETPAHRAAIARVRNRLIAEHLQMGVDEVERALAAGRLLDASAADGERARGVAPLPREEPAEGEAILEMLGDPERIVTAERFVSDMAGFKLRKPLIKWALGALVAVLVVGALFMLRKHLPDSASFTDRVSEGIAALRGSPWRVPLTLGAFVVGSIVSFPILVLIGATVIALGPVVGFLCAATGALLAAAVTFAIGRSIGRRPMRRWLGRKALLLERQLEGKGIVTVALIRKVPIAPFTIVNLFIGASGLPFRDFIVGTAIGMLPGIAAFALVGDRVVGLWRNPTPQNVTLVAVAVALWIGVVLGVQRLMNRFAKK